MKRYLLLIAVVISVTAISAHAGRTLQIGAMKWEPYSSPELVDDGFYVDLVRQAFARTGYEIRIDYFPWKRALHQMKNGELDGLIGAGYTSERTQFLSYPQYAWESDFYFYRLGKGPDSVSDFTSLCPATLGQVRGSRVTKLVQQLAPCMAIEFVEGVDKNLEKLTYGRIDYMINTPETMFYLFRKKHPEQVELLKRIEPSIEHVKIYTTFSKKVADYQAITEAYDKGIESMKQDGSYQALLKKHEMPE